MSRSIWIAVLATTAALALAGCRKEEKPPAPRGGTAAAQTEAHVSPVQVAQPAADAPGALAKAPTFALPDLQGNEVRLETVLQEKPVLLVFWATWCPNCEAEVPELNELYKAHGDKAALLAASVQESRAKVASFAQSKGIAYRVLLDEKGEVAGKYRVHGVPTLFVIDRDGTIRYEGHEVGEARDALTKLLAAT